MWRPLLRLLHSTRPWWPLFLGIALWLLLLAAMEIV
jgi:hypothetical protein